MRNNFRFKGLMKLKKEQEKEYELRNWMKFIEQSPMSNK